MPQLFKNNASGTLASAVTTSATTMVLTAGHGARFPAISGGDYFLLTLYEMSGTQEANHEIVKVTGRATDTLTVVRAQEGTAARAWGANSPIELRITAGTISDLVDKDSGVTAGTYGGASAVPVVTVDAKGRVTSVTTVPIAGGGGGGLVNFTEAKATAAPNATVPVVSLSATGAEANIDVALVPKGAGAIVASVPDGTAAGGNKRGQYAVDLQRSRTLAYAIASGNYSVVAGGERNQALASYSSISGGFENSASGDYCAILGGHGNSAYNQYSSVAGGKYNAANSNRRILVICRIAMPPQNGAIVSARAVFESARDR